MHPQATHFLAFCQQNFPEYFKNKTVLDVGAGDINGNSRHLFTGCEYIANDVCEAPNVSVVSYTKDLSFNSGHFDTIISSECFEHDCEYEQSFLKIYDMLKEGGLFCFTCASTDRPEHGTRRTSPQDSYGTIAGHENMADYYKNLTMVDMNEVLDVNKSFSSWKAYYNYFTKDLYFIGFKGEGKPIPTYHAPCCIPMSY